MKLLESIAGKVATGAVALGVVIGGITWWGMDPETRQRLLWSTGKIGLWLVLVIVLPWATYFLTRVAVERDSNAAGVVLVLGYTAVEVMMLLWLFGWNVTGAAAWGAVVVGGCVALAYNVLTCDWLAEHV
jgi:FtsH-binding integral membrane protein